MARIEPAVAGTTAVGRRRRVVGVTCVSCEHCDVILYVVFCIVHALVVCGFRAERERERAHADVDCTL